MNNIYLIGMMGSGKSSFGKKLASALKLHFVDLDKAIEKQSDKTISACFNELGEEGFRKLESAVLSGLSVQDTVIACGGGTPCFYDNLNFMKQDGKIVYLKMAAKTISDRLKHSSSPRPLLQGLKGEALDSEILKLLYSRSYYYHQADIIIDPLHLHAGQFADYLSLFYSR